MLAVLLQTSACSIIKPPKRPDILTFVLDAPMPAASEGVAQGNSQTGETRVLRVSTMASSGVYDTSQMAYSKKPEEIKYFATHRWAEPPPEMLIPILIAGLERTAHFPALIGPSSRAPGDLMLETQLLSFRQDFGGSKPQFHATVRASIMNAKNGAILGSPRTFDIVEPMDEEKPTAGVRAAGRAAAKLAEEIALYSVQTAEAFPPAQ